MLDGVIGLKRKHMQITEQRFPALRLMLSRKEDFPEVLPFTCTNDSDRQFINESEAFYKLFLYFAIRNSRSLGEVSDKTTSFNYVVCEELFEKYKYKQRLNPSNFIPYFYKSDYTSYGGMVISDLKDGLHYMYRIETRRNLYGNKKKYGVYFAIGYFKGNTFLGFEDGILDEVGEVMGNEFRYDGNTPVYGYLKFIGAVFRHIDRNVDPKDLIAEQTEHKELKFELVLLHKPVEET